MKIPGVSKLRQTVHRIQKRFSTTAIILMYHRVAEVELDPWLLCVTPEHFSEQLEVLRECAHPLSLRQFIKAHQTGTVPPRAVVVTFDDGYADNLYHAKPLLERYNIPATVFVSTGYIEQADEFWWDELERLLLQPGHLPERLTLSIDGVPHRWDLGEFADYSEEDYRRDRNAKAWEASLNSRLFFYYSVWQVLQPLSHHDRRKVLNEIAIWAEADSETRSTHRILKLEELIALGQSDLIEIGAHTVTHPFLSVQPESVQQNEIEQSKARLEKIFNRRVTSFSYPFGNYSVETVRLAQAAGFDCACSTVQAAVWNQSDRFQLPRFAVQNWSQENFSKQLQRWFHA